MPYYQHTALYPIIELVQRLVYGEDAASPAESVKQLERFCQHYRLESPTQLSLIASLLALSLPVERYPPLQLSPEQHRQQTLEALVTLIVALTMEQPVMLVVEDVHWIDPSSFEFLSLLIDQSPTVPLLMVLTCRPMFTPPWGLRTHLAPVALTRLAREHVAQMVTQVTDGHLLPPEVIEQIVAKTDGVPLFVEELTKLILDGWGRVAPGEPSGVGGGLSTVPIPATLHDSLMARLDQVGEAKRTAQLGATIGREFSLALLRAVSPLDEMTLEHDLARLRAAELVYRRGVGAQATYLFKHALLQEAAYTSLLTRTRQQYHQRIVEVLETQFPEIVEIQPVLLAHHAAHGMVWDKALRYFWQAGTDAMQQPAYREAVVCFEQALDALQHLPEDRDTRAQAIDLRFALRNAFLPLWQYDRLLATLREAETLAESLGEPLRLARVTTYLTHALFLTGAPEQALTVGQRAIALTAALDEPLLHLFAHFALAEVYFGLGQYASAIAGFRRNVEALGESQRYATRGTAHSAVLNLRWLAQSLAEVGQFTESVSKAEEAMRIAEEIANPYSLANAYVGAGYLYVRKGDIAKAVACYTRGMDVCQRWHIRQMLHGHALGVCVALGLSGQAAEALAVLEQVVGQQPHTGPALSGMP